MIEFLSLRLVFTRNALLVIWYLYLVATVLHLLQYGALLFVTGQSYTSLGPYYLFFTLLPPLPFALAQLALVRIFLEMAQHFIDKRSLSV